MDFTEICDSLAEQWPPWSERIRMLEFRDSPAARPVDNDGRNILYNERLLRYVTPEDCRYYIARELLHLQLHHFGRRGDREARLWKKAGDAVVNAMLRDEGFALPMNAVLPPEDAERSVESLYRVYLKDEEQRDGQDESDEVELIPDPRPDPEDKRAGRETTAQERAIEDPGLAAIVAGLVVLIKPGWVIAVFPMVAGVFVAFNGILNTLHALQTRRAGSRGWQILLVLSLLSIVVGILLFANPFAYMSTLVILLGAVLIYNGILGIIAAAQE